MGNGLPVAALEYLDSETMGTAARASPGDVPAGAFAVIARRTGPSTRPRAFASTCSRCSARTPWACTRRRRRPRSPRSGAGGTGSRSSSTHNEEEGERGHRRPARSARRGDRELTGDRAQARRRHVLLGPRRRRQSAHDIPPLRRRRARARPGADTLGRAVRARPSARGDDLGRARRRLRQAQLARTPTRAARVRAAHRRQARLRPEEPPQSGKKA